MSRVLFCSLKGSENKDYIVDTLHKLISCHCSNSLNSFVTEYDKRSEWRIRVLDRTSAMKRRWQGVSKDSVSGGGFDRCLRPLSLKVFERKEA